MQTFNSLLIFFGGWDVCFQLLTFSYDSEDQLFSLISQSLIKTYFLALDFMYMTEK